MSDSPHTTGSSDEDFSFQKQDRDKRAQTQKFNIHRARQLSATTGIDEDKIMQIWNLYDYLDPYSTGYISREQLKSVFASIAKQSGDLTSKMILRVLDSMEDWVSFEELLQVVGRNLDTSPEKQLQVYKALADHATGRISISTLGKLNQELNLGMTQTEIGAMINQVDPSGNGEVDVDELRLFLQMKKQ
eukprot:CAMPEP_0115005158 /NCGR_PEP_ID=MMETSP0216-20121206/19689_1 /TAXON_ID=223996 /ORGANISM="Protocruzia adherens, Strain Boccale" /LENGTH=188 /DNA_ID=CAMNT_0002371399 /DNA_START=227 /DNA_END=793 /DNA_ORIENTATION=-